MPETRITEGIRLSIIKLKNIQLFIYRLETKPEFKNLYVAKMQIESLKESLKYSQTLLNQLYQKAATHALKNEWIIPKKEE